MKLLSLIVPVYNEETSIRPFLDRVLPILRSLPLKYEILFVNDGSADGTEAVLAELQASSAEILYLSFSRNFGKEAALTAGFDFARGDAVIPMDVDLQDPPELIPQMVEHWQSGYESVIAVRQDRSEDPLLKRSTARWFYKILKRLSRVEIPENAGDYRLLDRKVVEVIKTLKERSRFMKGIFSWPGFRTKIVYFTRPARQVGNTKMNLRSLIHLALDGIFSFSTIPLRIWTYIGCCISLFAFIYAMIIIIKVVILGVDMPGYASTIVTTLFIGGIQLISLGILGEYIGRIYREVKQRPIYVVRETAGFEIYEGKHGTHE